MDHKLSVEELEQYNTLGTKSWFENYLKVGFLLNRHGLLGQADDFGKQSSEEQARIIKIIRNRENLKQLLHDKQDLHNGDSKKWECVHSVEGIRERFKIYLDNLYCGIESVQVRKQIETLYFYGLVAKSLSNRLCVEEYMKIEEQYEKVKQVIEEYKSDSII